MRYTSGDCRVCIHILVFVYNRVASTFNSVIENLNNYITPHTTQNEKRNVAHDF